MRRKLFTLCSAVSLLLCVGVCVLWVRSYWVGDQLRVHRVDAGRARWQGGYLNSGSGLLFASFETATFQSEAQLQSFAAMRPPSQGWAHKVFDGPPDGWAGGGSVWNRLGFYGNTIEVTGGGGTVRSVRRVQSPLWAVALPLALLPTASSASWARRRRRLLIGLCPSCGYDLRATPGRCPECGAADEMQASP